MAIYILTALKGVKTNIFIDLTNVGKPFICTAPKSLACFENTLEFKFHLESGINVKKLK